MRDYLAFRKAAIRYWERRRIIYNALLVPPSVFTYMIGAGVNRAGDDYGWHPFCVVFLFAISALGANFCYSFAYVLEFLLGSDDPSSRWLRFGRTSALIAGILFSMLLALIGGWNIALMEFYYR